MTAVGNIAGALFLGAYAVRRLWLLRVITIIGLVLNIIYYASMMGDRDLTPVIWNCAYLVLNVGQLIYTWRTRGVPYEESETS